MRISLDDKNPAPWEGFATFELQAFSLSCTYKGKPDPRCDKASAAPTWRTNYGWFEPMPAGVRKTHLLVPPPHKRKRQASGRVVLWSSDYNAQKDREGRLTVEYAGQTLHIPLKAYAARRDVSDNPIPTTHFQAYTRMDNFVFNDSKKARRYLRARAYRLSDPDYQQWQLEAAKKTSDSLDVFLEQWARGDRRPEVIPDHVLQIPVTLSGRALHEEKCPDRPSEEPCTATMRTLANASLRWKVVRASDVAPEDYWTTRPARSHRLTRAQSLYGNAVPEVDGVQTLGPDYNATYLRLDYVAPFDTTLVMKGEFPHARFFSAQTSLPLDPRYPSGLAAGAPEVPIVDVDIHPDVGSTNPFFINAARDEENRGYTLRFAHPREQISNYREGQGVLLNEESCRGSMTERGAPAYRCRHPKNLRIAGPFRSAGITTGGDLLPAQLWARYYVPDHPDGTDFDPYAGVSLPRIWMEKDLDNDGVVDRFMILPLRFPEAGGFGREVAIRRINGIFPMWNGENREDIGSDWDDAGFSKLFGFLRGIVQRGSVSGEYPKLFVNRRTTRSAFEKGLGRTHELQSIADKFGRKHAPTGALEVSATGCSYINYGLKSVQLDPGEVLVLTGRKPATPKTRDARNVMGSGQLRYFSITQMVSGPAPRKAIHRTANRMTLMDEDIDAIADPDGNEWFLIVLSRNGDKPALPKHATWRDWGPHKRSRLLVRWMSIMSQGSGTSDRWHDATWAPDGNNMPWETADYSAPDFDEKLLLTNDASESFMRDYHIVSRRLPKQAFKKILAETQGRPWQIHRARQ